MAKLNEVKKEAKKGRPFKDPIFKFRTWLWYWAVRDASKLNDGKLDIEFSSGTPDGAKIHYEDRVRIFEDIRKTGRTISLGDHKRREFNLVDAVNKHPNLKGSAEVYQSLLWEILGDKKPTLKQTEINFFKLIKICKLSTVQLHIYIPPNEVEFEKLLELTPLTPKQLSKLLAPEISINGRKNYDDILQSFSSVTHFFDIRDNADFQKISNYLNILAFYICLYRYALFTGNYHALISSAESINEHLSLLLLNIVWLERKFCRELFEIVYQRVFLFGNSSPLDELDIQTVIGPKESVGENSALNKLFELLNN